MIIRNWQRALRGVPSIFFLLLTLLLKSSIFGFPNYIPLQGRPKVIPPLMLMHIRLRGNDIRNFQFFFFFKIHRMSCFEAIHALKSFRFDCFFSVFFSICYSFKKRGCFDPFFERKKIEQKCGEDKQNKRQNQKMKTTKTLKIEQPHETCKCFAYHNVVVAAAVFDTVVVTASLVCCKFVRS